MNDLTVVGPENNALSRRYGAQSPLVHTMASDAFPIIPFGFRDLDEELVALRGDAMRASVFQGASAVAARFAAIGLANPSGSGVLAVLEGVWLSVGTAGRVLMVKQAIAVSALQASTQGRSMDSRQSELASVRALATDEAATANYGTIVGAVDVTPAAAFIELPRYPYVLAPLSTLWFVHNTANVGIQATFVWRQRSITGQESTT